MNTIYTEFTRFAKKAADWQSQVLATLRLHTGFIPEIDPLRLLEAITQAHTAYSINTRLFEAPHQDAPWPSVQRASIAVWGLR